EQVVVVAERIPEQLLDVLLDAAGLDRVTGDNGLASEDGAGFALLRVHGGRGGGLHGKRSPDTRPSLWPQAGIGSEGVAPFTTPRQCPTAGSCFVQSNPQENRKSHQERPHSE